MSGIIASPWRVTRQIPDCPIAFPALPRLEMHPALQQPLKLMGNKASLRHS